MISTNKSRSSIFGFVFASVVCLAPQLAAATTCPLVVAKNPQEQLMMEAGSNKQGCWVRNPRSGQLYFISDLAPSNGYKPLIRQPAPAQRDSPAPVLHLLSHGP